MKRIITIMIMTLLLVGCTKEITYKKISMNEAVQIIESEKNIIILDVRSRLEYSKGHIPNAINIDNEKINDNIVNRLPDKKKKILVYCQSGNRSKLATEKLIKNGYENVIDIGGIVDWPKELEK